MNGRSPPGIHAEWRQILALGEQLVSLSTLEAQKKLVEEAAARLIGGEASLWLADALGQPLCVQDVPSDEPTMSDLMCRAFKEHTMVLDGEEASSSQTLAWPLLAQDEVLGVLEIRRDSGAALDEDKIALIDGLVVQSSIALQTVRRVGAEQRRVNQLSLVREVSREIANIFGLDELCQRVADQILATFKYYYVALFTLDSGDDTLHLRGRAMRPDHPQPAADLLSEHQQIRLGQGMIGYAAQNGTEVLADDVAREPLYRYVDALPETRSEVVLPLKIEDRILGVLDVQSDQLHGFDETDMLVLRALADQIAIAVEDAWIYSKLQFRADQMAAVAEIGRAVVSILDLNALLEQVVDLIHDRFGYSFVHLLTVRPDQREIIYRAGNGPLGRELQAAESQPLSCSLDDVAAIVPWVACHGESVLANDVKDDPRYRPSQFSEAGARSELAVPLVFGGQVLGVLDVQSEGVFGQDDVSLLEALADSIAIAVRNANLYRSERWRRQVADSMREVAGLLSAQADLLRILDTILVELGHTLPCEAAGIWLLEGDSLRLSVVTGCQAAECSAELSPDDDPWLWRALDAEQPTLRPREALEPLGAGLGFPPDYSALATPLRIGQRRLGLLIFAHHTAGRYGAEARAMAAAFASYAAIAIENSNLYEEAQELASISTVMLQVSKATQSLTTLGQVLETVVNLVPMLAGVDRCAILLWDQAADFFYAAAAYGLNEEQQATFEEWQVAPGDESAFDDLVLNKNPIFIYDVAIDARLSEATVWTLGFESLLLLPLLAQGEVLGVMMINYRGKWSESTAMETVRDQRLPIIQGITHQTATAVENTRLREIQQEEAYVSAALLQVAQAVASLNDLDAILSVIVRITPILIGVERCAIFLWESESAVFRPAQFYGIPREEQMSMATHRYGVGDFPLLDAVRERDRLFICSPDGYMIRGEDEANGEDDVSLAPDFEAAFIGEFATGYSLLVVPLSVKGDVLGVMMLLEDVTLHRRSSERRFEIITGIAQQAALATQSDLFQQEMAERGRLERELQLAQEIQQAFMPSQMPDLPGWDLAVFCRPAREVGGDFYDFFELPGRRLGLVIADVADKGMPAALFMALTRALVRAAALEETLPAAALARVNDLLVPDAYQGMFVTAIYAVLDLETGVLTYANAGHNPPLVLRAKGQEVEWFATGGIALGVLEGVSLDDHAISLEMEDSVVFYTDGATEAFSSEEEFYGEERLVETVRAASGGSAQAMLEAIYGSVTSFAGDLPFSDDLTLLVLRRPGRAADAGQ